MLFTFSLKRKSSGGPSVMKSKLLFKTCCAEPAKVNIDFLGLVSLTGLFLGGAVFIAVFLESAFSTDVAF